MQNSLVGGARTPGTIYIKMAEDEKQETRMYEVVIGGKTHFMRAPRGTPVFTCYNRNAVIRDVTDQWEELRKKTNLKEFVCK